MFPGVGGKENIWRWRLHSDVLNAYYRECVIHDIWAKNLGSLCGVTRNPYSANSELDSLVDNNHCCDYLHTNPWEIKYSDLRTNIWVNTIFYVLAWREYIQALNLRTRHAHSYLLQNWNLSFLKSRWKQKKVSQISSPMFTGHSVRSERRGDVFVLE